MRKLVVPLGALTIALTGAASAQEPDRYRLEKSADGYVRMDTRTGQMSLCRERETGRLVCAPADDEDVVSGKGAQALQMRVDELEARVEELERDVTGDSGLPSDEEFEQTLGFMERFFRSFMDIVREFESEPRESEPAPDAEET